MNTSPTILKVVASGIPIDPTPSVNTADCFKEGFAYCDSNIDTQMTEQIPSTEGGTVTCHELTEDGHNFMDVALKLLSKDDRIKPLDVLRGLIEQGKTFSPRQVEDLHKRFVAGETQIGLNTNSSSNLFFVHDEKGGILALSLVSSFDGWQVVRVLYADEFLIGDRVFFREPKKDTQ